MKLPDKTPGNIDWFVNDRFGMFIHWGLYALPARGEWIRKKETIDVESYDVYLRHFDPDLYDPELWADSAAKAGMKYFVMTAKHHDGFCMWDTDFSPYKVTNSKYGRDVLFPLINGFRDRGLRTGLYYSLLDWHHKDYIIDSNHPERQAPDALEKNRKRDMRKYADYMRKQVKELLTKFGNIDILWFDMSYDVCEWEKSQGFSGKGKADWESEELIKMIRDIQPGIIMNNRLDIEQDFRTPEQFQPVKCLEVNGKRVYWESCQTLNGSWGYNRNANEWKTPEQLLKLLINAVSNGGNLLMNVSPTGRGELDGKTLKSLDVYAKWMRLHSRSIYGCTESDFKAPENCAFTQNGKKLYLHIFSWPFKHIHIDGLNGKVEYAQLLNDASEVKIIKNKRGEHGNTSVNAEEGTVILELPVKKPDVIIPVVEIFLK